MEEVSPVQNLDFTLVPAGPRWLHLCGVTQVGPCLRTAAPPRTHQCGTQRHLYIKREGQSVLASSVREVLPLPPQRYRNGATMYGIRIVSVGGGTKDLYTDDREALHAWATDLARSTPVARELAQRKAAAEAAAAAATQPLMLLPPPARSTSSTGAAASGASNLHLADICEVDWSNMLGSGLFACVLRARMHNTGEAVAVKIIKTEAYREYADIVERETMVWAAAGRHPHVAQLKQTLRSSDRIYFIAELCEGGGIVERLAASATYCEREVAWLARQLLAAVQHLHDNAIVHMDIKPENLVFATRRENSCIKLIDFSLASFFYSPTDPGGTPDFVAPELLNQPEHYAKNGCGPEVDMWAVGVMIFFLLSGQTPFQAPSLEGVLQRVKTGEWAFHGRRWALVSEGARDLVSCLLKLEPSQRLSATEALDHPWLRQPDSLSQALLQDAISAFRMAATAAMQQQRTSWLKQASGDLMTTTGTNATNLSPHTSLGRFAVMAGSVGPASLGGMGVTGMGVTGMGAALNTGGHQSLMGLGFMSTGAADAVAVMMGPSGAGASSAVMMTSSVSHHQLNQAVVAAAAASAGAGAGVVGYGLGGNSGRGSLAGGQRGSSAAAAAAAAGLTAGSSPPPGGGSYTPGHRGSVPQQHSFTSGVGARYAAAVAMAPHYSGSGAPSPPRLPMPTVTARLSPHGAAPRLSPHHSHHSPGGGAGGGSNSSAQRSPRSPLGMRTRRASDTMAYTLAITERQESIHQMQAQGLPVPPAAGGLAWPGLPSAKARRTSELLPGYGTGSTACVVPSPSDSQAELAVASAAAGAVSVDRGNHSAPGTRYLQQQQQHPHHLLHHHHHHHPHFGNPPPLRGASGLSVMTSAAGVASEARGDGRPTGGRSNPELFSMLRVQSSNGEPSGVSSSAETVPYTSSRDGAVVARNSWTNVPDQVASQVQGQGQAPAQGQAQGQGQTQEQQQQIPQGDETSTGAAEGQGQVAADAVSPGPCDQTLLAKSNALRHGVPGKSQSYNVMPSVWLERPAGRGQGSAQGYGPAAAAAAGSLLSCRRASNSFTLGTSAPGLAIMPHGPSPLSNSSGGRNFVADAQAAAATAVTAAAAAAAPSGGAAPGPTPAMLMLKRPSRGVSSGGGNLVMTRSNSINIGTAAAPLGSQVSSHASLPGNAYGPGAAAAASGGGAAAAAAAAGGTPAAGSGSAPVSSMYAAVLRSNLSGHGLISAGAGGSGGASSPSGAADGASGGVGVDAGRRSGLSGSSGGAVAVPAAPLPAAVMVAGSPPTPTRLGPTGGASPLTAAAVAAAAAQPRRLAAGAGVFTVSSNSAPFVFAAGGGGGSGSGVAPFAVAGPSQWPDVRQSSDPAIAPPSQRGPAPAVGHPVPEELRGMLYSSGSNAISGSNLMVSDRFATQGSFMEATFMTAAVHGAAQVRSGPGCAPGDASSGGQGRVLGSTASDGSGVARGGGGGGGENRRLLGPQVRSALALVRGAVPATNEADGEVFSIGFNIAGPCDDGSSGSGGAGPGSALAAAAAADNGQRRQRPPSDTRARSETRPRSDSPASGVRGPGSPSSGGGAAAAAQGEDLSPKDIGGGGVVEAPASSIIDTLRSVGIAPRASSRLVLETIPSEDPDSLSGLLRSVREERAAAAGAAAAGVITAPTSGPIGAASCASGPSGFGSQVSASLLSPTKTVAPPPPPPPLPVQQQQLLSLPPSPLSRQPARAFLSPQASSTNLGGGSPLPSSISVADPVPMARSTSCRSSGAGVAAEEQRYSPGRHSRVSGPGFQAAAPGGGGGTPASSSSSIRSAGSGKSGSVRRVATVNNLRLHATTAAAAQAAAAAAAAAADASWPPPPPPPTQPAAPEQDPFAGWDYPPPPPSPLQARQRASSSVGLSGPSLVALLAQAAPLAQAAQAHAAQQLASQSGSAGSSFSSQRGGVIGGASGSLRSAGGALMAAADGTAAAAQGGGSVFASAAAAAADGGGGSGNRSPRGIRHSVTSTNLSLSVQGQILNPAFSLPPPPQQQQQVVQKLTGVGSRGTSGGSGGTRYLAISQAAQAASAQAALRAASFTQTSTNAATAALVRAGGGGSVVAGGSHGRTSGTATPQSPGSESPAGSPAWVRRATTSNDLRDRVAVQMSGNSMIHRLASQQGPSLAAAAAAACVTSGGGGGAAMYSSSPPREPGSPASMSSRGSTFPVVPSRLSNSGAAPTGTGRGVGNLPSPSCALSPSNSFGATNGGGGGGGGGSSVVVGGVAGGSGGLACSGGSSGLQGQGQRTLVGLMPSAPPPLLLQSMPSVPTATYQQQLHQMHQMHQMQQQQQLLQLQHFHNMQQLRHQQQKAAASSGRTSRPEAGQAGGGVLMSQLRASTSAYAGVFDSATQPAGAQDGVRLTSRRSSCTQLPLPQLCE